MLILDKILRIYQFVYDFTTLEDTLQLKTIIFYILNLKNIWNRAHNKLKREAPKIVSYKILVFVTKKKTLISIHFPVGFSPIPFPHRIELVFQDFGTSFTRQSGLF